MKKQRTVGGASSPASLESTFLLPGALPRSSRRATARRASSRRATARQLRRDLEGRIIEYMKDHPRSTTGDIAKGVDAERGRVAAQLARITRLGLGDVDRGPGGPRIIDDRMGDDRLDDWVDSGPSAAYTFLYRT
jgi:hypothetical protein